jgi:hypothetical protein
MADTGGFAANEEGLRGLAGFSHDRASDVRTVTDGLNKRSTGSANTLGDAGALDAYNRFFGAWTDELNIISTGLDEIAQKFTETADHYKDADVHWSHNFQAVEPQ